jgi:uncharacterized protein YgbK (DUF1537 family)
VNPIVVIADDLSGAAELAGVAVRSGLTAEVRTDVGSLAEASDVVCIDADTRTLPSERAAGRVEEVTRAVVAEKPAWLFKKCDSVLRGSVAEEAAAMAQVVGAKRLLLAPANPSLGRHIREGIYSIYGTLLHETSFARDPSHPRRSSHVRDLVKETVIPLSIPDVTQIEDLDRLAVGLERETLPVGAADFFAALLSARTVSSAPAKTNAAQRSEPGAGKLLVCGSTFAWPERLRLANERGVTVAQLPHATAPIVEALERGGVALMGVGDSAETRGRSPEELSMALAETVASVLRTVSVRGVLLEGGSTAAAVMRRMKWTRLQAQPGPDPAMTEFVPAGVTRPRLMIKPGSYPWPASVWP